MMGGFLFLFSAGFLMTALPQFTASFPMVTHEWIIFGLLTLFLSVTALLQDRFPFHFTLALSFTFLIRFFIWRIFKRTAMPPPPLWFALIGLFVGLAGITLIAVYEKTGQTEVLLSLGRLFFYQGMQLFLVLGVGLFLIPNLLGNFSCSPPMGFGNSQPAYLASIPKPFWTIATLLIASFILEAHSCPILGRMIRAMLFSLVAFHDWKMMRLPRVRSTLSIGLWISCWFLIGGLWLQVMAPNTDLHVRHLTYIGGFSLMTLMIATRVTLAHGGHDLRIEKDSLLLKITLGLIVLAALTRASARFLPEAFYWQHLGYSALAWMGASFLWAWLCLPKIPALVTPDGNT